MVTPYCDVDGWADREAGLTWSNYRAAEYTFPESQNTLESALEMGARIINKTIGFITSNITGSAYADWLTDLNYQLANRIMSVRRNRGFEGGGFRFSPQDYLFIDERTTLREIGKIHQNRRIGRIVF